MLNLVLLTLFSILPSLIPTVAGNGIIGVNGIDGCNIAWFITLFYVACYIRKYQDKLEKYSLPFYLSCYFGSVCLMVINHYLFYVVEKQVGIMGWMSDIPFNNASVLNVIASIALFMVFLLKKDHMSRGIQHVVEKVVPTTFGIYIIHENPFIRSNLWNFVIRIFGNGATGITYIGQILFIAILVFIICGFVEEIRLKLMKNIQNSKIINRISNKVDNAIYGAILIKQERVEQ